jgi:hypothetical protein
MTRFPRTVLVLAILSLFALALTAQQGATAPKSGGVGDSKVQSPGGTVDCLDVDVETQNTEPQKSDVTITEENGTTHMGEGSTGLTADTCYEMDPIELSDGNSVRIHEGEMQWHNQAWKDGVWRDMKPDNDDDCTGDDDAQGVTGGEVLGRAVGTLP